MSNTRDRRTLNPNCIPGILIFKICFVCTFALLGISYAVDGPSPNVGTDYDFDPRLVHIESIGDYDRITYEGAEQDYSQRRIGHPQLPILGKWFILPDQMKIERLDVTVARWDTLPGTYLPTPIQSDDGTEWIDPDMPT
ncbi:MAG: hypothetical protein KJ970_13895 [Candidatus Eisenbacteria bacterium]|uniref:Gingipain propeptide domain-containing protein n=1 Tax=Eiseniibacteriota bacterium TaxID=2212470 RepID=A0A948RYM8_UNCEI|nr:hypothetical protein [Candidatus Eisenbacteria bacterium]MBU1949881.1 hypothetical protein [Candidatus Eisenbacteria bacterium]MBU2692008.1 hypothetical protein [Candidatus Eisenbacteria bacterium]